MRADELPLLIRVNGHLTILGLTVFALLAMQWMDIKVSVSAASVAPAKATGGGDWGQFQSQPILTSLIPAAVPFTIIPKRKRREIAEYLVQPNDSVTRIAERFDITPETVVWANAQLEDDPDLLTIGETLKILPTSGVLHVVASSETTESIAKKYKVEPSVILNYEWNGLNKDTALTAGQKIIVPGGTKPIPPRWVRANTVPIPKSAASVPSAARGSGKFGWPVSGVITQKYWAGHLGIDVGASTGTPIYAADSGVVIFSGWDNTGFGKMILIDHGNGFITTYGHLSVFAVAPRDSVKKGQLIGRVGSTGRSTGPHLDFRIKQDGVWVNPFTFLK